jgi:hypothetical protein
MKNSFNSKNYQTKHNCRMLFRGNFHKVPFGGNVKRKVSDFIF